MDFLTAFHFRVGIGVRPARSDCSFLEVSGLGNAIGTEDLAEGGENRFVWKLPTANKQQNLILKRGMAPIASALVQWCRRTFEEGTGRVVTKDVAVMMLNKEGFAVRSWVFQHAYPLKWQVQALDAKKNDIAIETIELVYHECRCDS
jgi:phage tail-like protein